MDLKSLILIKLSPYLSISNFIFFLKLLVSCKREYKNIYSIKNPLSISKFSSKSLLQNYRYICFKILFNS